MGSFSVHHNHIILKCSPKGEGVIPIPQWDIKNQIINKIYLTPADKNNKIGKNMNKLQNKLNITGISLLETLVVITIISVLSAIGYPNYVKFKLETRREEAHSMLINTHSVIQNFLIATNTPALQSSDLNTLYPSRPFDTPSEFYRINIEISSPDYTITATAINKQLEDLKCRRIVLKSNGNRVSYDSSNVYSNKSSTVCW